MDAGFCSRCQVQLAYAIGVVEPVSVRIDTFGGADEEKLVKAVRQCFGLTPRQIIEHFDLRRPIYEQTSAYGHFGCVTGIIPPWEKTDMDEQLWKAYCQE